MVYYNKLLRCFILMYCMTIFLSCSDKKRHTKLCECLSNTEKFLSHTIEGDDLPEDLTCVMSYNSTYTYMTNEIINLYKELHNSQFSIVEENEERKELKENINDWLGGSYRGECGNFYNGLNLAGYNGFDEKVTIVINITKLKWTNHHSKQVVVAPYTYLADIIFNIKVFDSEGNFKESSILLYNIVISTCHQFVENQE